MHRDQFEAIFLEPMSSIHKQRLSHPPAYCRDQHASSCQDDADILGLAVDVASQPLALFRGPYLVLIKLHLHHFSTMSRRRRPPEHDTAIGLFDNASYKCTAKHDCDLSPELGIYLQG
jgi:hypothetical protein